MFLVVSSDKLFVSAVFSFGFDREYGFFLRSCFTFFCFGFFTVSHRYAVRVDYLLAFRHVWVGNKFNESGK